MKSGLRLGLFFLAFVFAIWPSMVASEGRGSLQTVSKRLPYYEYGLLQLSIGELRRAVISTEQQIGITPCPDCVEPDPVKFVGLEKSVLAGKDELRQKFEKVSGVRTEIVTVREKITAAFDKINSLRQLLGAIEYADRIRDDMIDSVETAEDDAYGFGIRRSKRPRYIQRLKTNLYTWLNNLDRAKEVKSKHEKDLEYLTREVPLLIARHEGAMKRLDAEFAQLHQRNKEGLTWLQRAIIHGDDEFIDYFKKELGEDRGLLKTELRDAVCYGDSKKAQALIALGADVGQMQGDYSLRALANIFGEGPIARLMIRHGDRVDVPWNPKKGYAEARLRLLTDQVNRVQSFCDSCSGLHAGIRTVDSGDIRTVSYGGTRTISYDEDLLKFWRCRIDYLNKVRSSIAAN